MINARLCALSGIPVHSSGGEISSPSHVYLAGMEFPSEKAGLDRVIENVVSVSGEDVGEGWQPIPTRMINNRNRNEIIRKIRCLLIF
jgi:hypothetical protein